jgi:electron-transferring-flavoprotein dehydrogenase
VTLESMDFDVVVVGAGPSGLSAAICVKQLNPDLTVCVLEKGSEVGAHILSGAVFESTALDELIPDWGSRGAPLYTEVEEDRFLFLTETKAIRHIKSSETALLT